MSGPKIGTSNSFSKPPVFQSGLHEHFISGGRADFLPFQLVDVHRGTNFFGDLAEMLVARQVSSWALIGLMIDYFQDGSSDLSRKALEIEALQDRPQMDVRTCG